MADDQIPEPEEGTKEFARFIAKVPGQKVGRHWRFHKLVIDRWLGDKSDWALPGEGPAS